MIALRDATFSDWAVLFALRNDPESVRYSRTGLLVSLDEHLAWLKRTLDTKSTRLYIGRDTDSGRSIGMVRLVQAKKTWEASIAISAAFRTAGIGSSMLATALDLLPPGSTVAADVFEHNYPSLRLFGSLGFSVSSIGDLASEDRRELGRLVRLSLTTRAPLSGERHES